MPDPYPRTTESGVERPHGLLRRHVTLIVTTVVLVAAGAYGYARLEAPTYTASARVLVSAYTLPNTANPAPDMGTEQAIATSGVVTGNAAHALGVTPDTVRKESSVAASATADVLDFGYSATSPDQASRGATATAAAYMAYRAAQSLPSPRRVDITKTLAVPAVKTRLISPALPPGAPSAPDPVLDVIAGIIVGLLVGIAAAFVVDRFGRRLRSPARWEEATGVPVLAGLPVAELIGARVRTDERPAADTGDRIVLALHYLRVRVSHALRPGGAVLLLTTVREQAERTVVARSVVDGFADMGWRCALLPLSSETAESVEHVLRRLERVRAANDLVVVTAPPISSSVMALDVAGRADAALIIDDLGTARRKDATELIGELRATGCRVVGCVLLGVGSPRLGTASTVPAGTDDVKIPASESIRSRTHPLHPAGALVDWTEDDGATPTHDQVNGSM
jgi:capsular polysaccharide biosynthesis protein